jgi:hypothetical protein
MVSGFWLNQDGLPLQFGTQKVIPELGGDYLMYGENREVEAYINLGATSFGFGAVQNPGLPGTTFSGTGTPNAAGIVSLTTLFPLQAALITVGGITETIPPLASSAGVLTFLQPHLWIDQIDLEVIVAATAGTGGATGLAGVGLVTTNPTNGQFAQVTPNAGVQLLGATTNAKMAVGMHYTWYSDGTAFGTASPPTAGSWLGNVPVVTNSITPLPTNGFISALTTGGPYTGTNAGGLLKLRVRYNYYGVINQ